MKAEPGFVYVLHSPATAQGLHKIGMTRSDGSTLDALERRVQEVSSATGAPGRYSVIKYQHFANCVVAERRIHSQLREYHYYAEFFWLPTITVVEEVFASAEHYEAPLFDEDSRTKRLIRRSSGMRWAADLEISQAKRSHLDYVEGRNMMRHSPEHGERLLLRAAGKFLPPELSYHEDKITRALRWLGIFHTAGNMYEPYAEPRKWPWNPSEESLSYMKSTKAIRYLTLAGKDGDYISWGLLGQHLLTQNDMQGATNAFAAFAEGLATACETSRSFMSSTLQSPAGSSEIGRTYHELQYATEILSSATDHILTNKLPPFPVRAREILAPLFERSPYRILSNKGKNIYQYALQGLQYGPVVNYRPLRKLRISEEWLRQNNHVK